MEKNDSKEQARQDTSQNESQASEWCWPYHQWAPGGENVEFITVFGIRHLGISVQADTEPRTGVNKPYMSQIVLMAEDTEYPEYFSGHQVEKWRITTERVPKKRLLGITELHGNANAGQLTPMFLTYLHCRLVEKMLEYEGPKRIQIDATFRYSDTDDRQMWETKVHCETPAGYFCVHLEEYQGRNLIQIKIDGHGSTGVWQVKDYDYKNVVVACEEIARYVLDVPVR